ncbi:hypothetical protein A8144_10595 [Mycobacterium leprae 3125609]|uniref:T2168a n=1 Tax=Mycobacterium leprae TaxID=1769 RepID=Q49809_MYCLR|nr:hypothetical protein [Mycobacterium leprae]AAA17224.1 t2168a [Mycobacterium leprae]OAR20414.1 hypothetical protein A8144_10595 [Mycobacterium leprae 3125609]OAX70458.1 hypothetical protein A3216_11940 [Mycobacterium leprae 7935681]
MGAVCLCRHRGSRSPPWSARKLATIAAVETSNSECAVQYATNTVVARIVVFFIGSVFLLVVLLPWDSVQVGASP